MTAPPLAVQLYSLRGQLGQDRPAVLDRLAGLGIATVEPFGVGRGDAQQALAEARALRADLDRAGLSASATHAAAPLGEQAAWVLEAVALTGAELLIVPSPSAAGFDWSVFEDEDATRELGRVLRQCAQVAREHGLRLGYHNHWQEFTRWPDGRLAYETLLEEAGPDVELQVDTYWAQTGGVDPAALIERHSARVGSLHLKDGPAQPNADQQPAGTGVMDLRAAVLAAGAARWHVLEVDRCAGDPFDLIAGNARWMIDQGLSSWGTPGEGTRPGG